MSSLFTYLVILSILILFFSSIFSLKKEKIKYLNWMMFLFFFLWVTWFVLLWKNIERLPIRTLGETRMWYSFLTPLIAWGLTIKYKWKWIIPYSSLISIIFLIINLITPENFDKELLPALQSIWFIPHVLVYMFAYAMFGVATLISIRQLWFSKNTDDKKYIESTKILIYVGFSFLTLGLLFGAIWAKEAWGHYWTWDPKEIWAMITWFAYLLYIHYSRLIQSSKTNAYIIILSFIILLICWFGVNYLPIANQSIHTY